MSCPTVLQKLSFRLGAAFGTYVNGSGRIKYLQKEIAAVTKTGWCKPGQVHRAVMLKRSGEDLETYFEGA